MGPVFLLLRIIHILAALVWFGVAFTMAVFILPTARRMGPEGGRFVQNLASESGLTITLGIAGWLTVIAGSIMFPMVTGGFDRDFMRSPHGIALGFGAVMGILSVLHGATTQGPTAARLGALGREIAAAGGPPTPDQLARVTALRGRLQRNGNVHVVMLALTACAMAVARYL